MIKGALSSHDNVVIWKCSAMSLCVNLQNISWVGHSGEATGGVELWHTQTEVGHFPNRSWNNLINNNYFTSFN